MGPLGRRESIEIVAAGAFTLLAAVLFYAHAGSVFVFAVSAVSLALLAALVGLGTDQISARLGPGATGMLQSALGNLPELFVGIFALRQGLTYVVQAALVGSILGNSLLVLGLAFILGGWRHGTQRFNSTSTRMIATLTLLAISVMAIPTFSRLLHTPAAGHPDALSVICALTLLVTFAASLPFSLDHGGQTGVPPDRGEAAEKLWPLWLAMAVLVAAGGGSAFVSDWFVAALTPATQALHISEGFTGLVIVALAGNAVENVVGVQLAVRNKPDYAISVILNSSLQVALALTPVLVLLSYLLGGAHLSLVLPPLLLVALGLSAVLGALIVVDGESTWLEGVMLVGLYVVVAGSFWWG